MFVTAARFKRSESILNSAIADEHKWIRMGSILLIDCWVEKWYGLVPYLIWSYFDGHEHNSDTTLFWTRATASGNSTSYFWICGTYAWIVYVRWYINYWQFVIMCMICLFGILLNWDIRLIWEQFVDFVSTIRRYHRSHRNRLTFKRKPMSNYLHSELLLRDK